MGVNDLQPLDMHSCFFEDEKEEVVLKTIKHDSGRSHPKGTYQLFESETHRKVPASIVCVDVCVDVCVSVCVCVYLRMLCCV